MKLGASYSTINETELLSRLLPEYQIENPRVCRFWQRGVNDTYQIHCSHEIYSLRVYRHALRTRVEIEFEMAALHYLKERGAEVAYPIAKREGGFVTAIQAPEGLRYAVVTTHAKGAKPNYRQTNAARLFGASVAELHHLSDGFQTKHQRPRLEIEYLLNTSLGVINPFIKNNQQQLDFLESTATNIRQAVDNTQQSKLDVGFCHGDFHGGNVHDDNGKLTHFDFDCCGFGLRVFDLATFRWDCLQSNNGPDVWPSFLEAYQSIRTISPQDLALVDYFVMVRHIWWMALIMGNVNDFGYDEVSDEFIDIELGFITKVASKLVKH